METIIHDLQSKIIKLKKENEYLNSQCYSFGHQLDRVTDETEELREELEECAIERDNLEDECIRLKEEIQQLKKESKTN